MEDKIIIYGAGKYGKKLRELFKSWNIKVDYFCQSAVGDKIYYEGIPVIPATELSEICGKKHIMIALADRTVSYEIKKQLMQNKTLENIFVYEWGNFIKENDNNLVQIEEGDKYCNICFRRIKNLKHIPLCIRLIKIFLKSIILLEVGVGKRPYARIAAALIE